MNVKITYHVRFMKTIVNITIEEGVVKVFKNYGIE